MNILYISNACSRARMSYYNDAAISDAAQKYNRLLAEGLAANHIDIEMICNRPMNRKIDKHIKILADQEREHGVEYQYIPLTNIPIIKNITAFLGVFKRVVCCKKDKKNTFLLCDILNLSSAVATLVASKIKGYMNIAVVTDVPGYMANNKKSFIGVIHLFLIKQFASYLLLTRQMNDIVNPCGKPFLVLEGHVDIEMRDTYNALQRKEDKRVCLYAGSLSKIYGIEYLVKGFLRADIENCYLDIYGVGDYEKELAEIVRKHANIRYYGRKPNEVVVAAEQAATLLINPRPTSEEYTKYSFPSKNMEYMVSGTPLLTTKLPGMPIDHVPYVFLIEDETEEGMEKVLKRILSMSNMSLNEFGLKAKQYVLREKSNVMQAQKLIHFISLELKNKKETNK